MSEEELVIEAQTKVGPGWPRDSVSDVRVQRYQLDQKEKPKGAIINHRDLV